MELKTFPLQQYDLNIAGLVPLTFGVTGHRDPIEEDWLRVEARIRELLKSYRLYYPNTPFIIISPLAAGADCLVAKCILETDAQTYLYAVLPFQEGQYLEDFAGVERVSYQELIQSSRLIGKQLIDDRTERLSQEQKNDAYQRTGEFVALHAHVMFAIKNSEDNKKKGGTAQIFQFRLDGCLVKDAADMPVIRYAESGLLCEFRIRRKSDIAMQIPSDQDDRVYITPQSESQARLEKKINLRLNESARKWTERRKRQLRAVLKKLKLSGDLPLGDEIARHIDLLNAAMLKKRTRLAKPTYPQSVSNEEVSYSKTICEQTSELAMERQNKYKQLLKLLLFITLGASFAQLASSIDTGVVMGPFLEVISYVKLPLVVVGVGIWKLIKKVKTAQESYRTISEALKVQNYWLTIGCANKSPTDHFLAAQLGQNSWMRRALRTVWMLDLPQMDVNKKLPPEVCRARLQGLHGAWVDGQVKYFRDKLVKLKAEDLLTRQTSYGLLVVGGTLLFINYAPITLYLGLASNVSHLIGLVGECAVAGYLVLAALREFNSYELFIKRYDVALHIFTQASQIYESTIKPDADKTTLVQANDRLKYLYVSLGEAVLDEASDWFIANARIEFKAR
jgi:hypothetical protein